MFRTMKTRLLGGLAILATTTLSAQADAGAPYEIGIHGGVGFDPVDPGIALSAGVGYRAPLAEANWLEGVVDVFHHTSEESWEEGTYEGVESLSVTLVATRVNMLIGYGRGAVHPVVGVGFFAAGVYWEETENPIGDPSLRSTDDFEGTAFGNIFNLGLGVPLGPRAELRAEVPVLIFWGAERNSVSLPMTASIGLRF